MIDAKREALKTQIKQHEAHIVNLKKLLDTTPRTYTMKVRREFFDAIIANRKTSEVREWLHDREFKVNDYLCLSEQTGDYTNLTGRKCVVQITHVLKEEDFPEGLMLGYCVLSIKLIGMTS